jgi:hypothetical protein
MASLRLPDAVCRALRLDERGRELTADAAAARLRRG